MTATILSCGKWFITLQALSVFNKGASQEKIVRHRSGQAAQGPAGYPFFDGADIRSGEAIYEKFTRVRFPHPEAHTIF
jgi:hypothetical protein